jgi:Flp pilus assembly protein TadG
MVIAFTRHKGFGRDPAGNVGVIFALALLPLLSLAGAALDYTRFTSERAKLQQATDAAALQAVLVNVSSNQERINEAKAVVASANLKANASAVVNGSIVTVLAEKSVNTTFIGALGIESTTIGARSSATRSMDGAPACVLALNPTASGAITFSGNASFTGVGCAVQSNSSSPTSLVAQGSATVHAEAICSAGGFSSNGGMSPKPQSNCPPLPDPYDNLPRPPSGGCDFSNVSIKPNETVTLQKGTYCNGLELKGTVTLSDGLYIIKDGSLTITSQAVVTGKNITFFLTGTSAGFSINGGGKLDISAPTAGVYGGIVLYQDPSSNVGAANTMNGNGDTRLVGVIYTPRQSMKVSGNTSFGDHTPLMSIIADTVTFTGSATAKTEVTGIAMAAPLPRVQGGARLIQ